MAEVVTMKEVCEMDFFGHALINMVANHREALAEVLKDRPGTITVELKLGGVEVSLRPFIKLLEEQFQSIVNKAASRKVEEEFQTQFRDRFNAIGDLLDEAERGLRDQLVQAGLVQPEER